MLNKKVIYVFLISFAAAIIVGRVELIIVTLLFINHVFGGKKMMHLMRDQNLIACGHNKWM